LAKDEVDCCSFSLSGSKFITGGDDGLVYLYSMVDYSTMTLELQSIEPRLITCFDTHSAPLNDVSFSKDGRLFASGCKCGDLVIYTFNPLLEKYEWKKISVSQYSRKENSQNDDTLGTFALNNVKYSVEITIIAWNADSSRVITVSSDFIPRVN
jgi:WD40 repeat protein